MGWTTSTLSGANTSSVTITIDGSNDFEIDWYRDIVEPANNGSAGYDESVFIHLGLIECLSDFEVEVTLPSTSPGSWETSIAGWYS
jgi:hypothetical protein